MSLRPSCRFGFGYDMRPAEDSIGMPAAINVATPHGWRRLDQMRTGDLFLTVSAGPRPLLGWTQTKAPRLQDQVQLPAGAFGNREPVTLPEGQLILLQGAQTRGIGETSNVLVPAAALVGWRGAVVCRAPQRPMRAPGFADACLIYAGPGLILACPAMVPPVVAGCVTLPGDPSFPTLSLTQARQLVATRVAASVGMALALG